MNFVTERLLPYKIILYHITSLWLELGGIQTILAFTTREFDFGNSQTELWSHFFPMLFISHFLKATEYIETPHYSHTNALSRKTLSIIYKFLLNRIYTELIISSIKSSSVSLILSRFRINM
jgi:hypothetical protein